jgi:hypothetical protein
MKSSRHGCYVDARSEQIRFLRSFIMIRRSLLAVGTVGLLALVGCSAPADQATTPSSVVDQAATNATGAAAGAAGAAKDGAMGAADATKDAAGAVKDGAMGAADAAKDAAGAGMAAVMGGAGELMTVVTNTKTAVEAGDFATAKTEFAKFSETWTKVGEGIKTASPDAYSAIETGVGNVTTALNEANPDKTKVMDALTALTTSLGGVK